jgi:hypothetical protein
MILNSRKGDFNDAWKTFNVISLESILGRLPSVLLLTADAGLGLSFLAEGECRYGSDIDLEGPSYMDYCRVKFMLCPPSECGQGN